jgi:hypothetical protein
MGFLYKIRLEVVIGYWWYYWCIGLGFLRGCLEDAWDCVLEIKLSKLK